MKKFRMLRADEIDCRVGTVTEKGCSLLLYKDARCDMNILDETVGPENWQKRYCRENANCIVSIWSDARGEWISKEDTGTESNTEKEKGLASDSFKRACVNWGIGRELYSAPFIWIKAADAKIEPKKYGSGGFTTKEKFYVSQIEYENDKISALEIVNKNNKAVYTFGKTNQSKTNDAIVHSTAPADETQIAELRDDLKIAGIEEAYILKCYRIDDLSKMTISAVSQVRNNLERFSEAYEEWKAKQG